MYYRARDQETGEIVQEWPVEEGCGGGPNTCGGCCECMASQAAAAGFKIEEVEKVQKWDLRFLELACLVRTWSKDPSTKHATVIVRPDRSIAGIGYNGFAQRCPVDESEFAYPKDPDFRASPEGVALQKEKYSRVIHGEMNAIFNAHEPVRGYTAYVTSGVPCDRCAVHLIQAGIARVVVIDGDKDYWARWGEAAELSLRYLDEAGVCWEIVDMNSGTVKRKTVKQQMGGDLT